MPTPAERRALMFFAALALLGAGVRVRRAAVAPPPEPVSRAALHGQLAAVDSAREARRAAASEPKRGRRAGKGSRAGGAAVDAAARVPVDLDRASLEEIEALPWIGPALAIRIVEDRVRNGPFGSLEALQRVSGIGPATARRIAPYVTFSLSPRPPSAVQGGAWAPAKPRAEPRRRGGRHP